MKKMISMFLVMVMIISAISTNYVSAAAKIKQQPVITVEKVTVNKGYTKEVTPITVENIYGNISFTFADKTFKNQFKLDKKTGALSLKKKVKEGKYNVKIKITAKGDSQYQSYSKTVTVKVVVNPADKGSVWTGKADTSWFTGDKTEYDIKTADEFAGFSLIVNDKKSEFYDKLDGATVNLKTDIVLNETTEWEKWSKEYPAENVWTPIGKYGNIITGTEGCVVNFNGNNHTIRGMYYCGSDYCGVFGYASGISIRNLNIEKAVIIAQDDWRGNKTTAGALVGRACNCYIENCNANNIRIDGENFVGGLVGQVVSSPAKYMWFATSIITAGLGFVINPLILKAVDGNEDDVNGTIIVSSKVSNARLRGYKVGYSPTVGGLVGCFGSDGIVTDCSTKKIRALSVDYLDYKPIARRINLRLDHIKEDEDAGKVAVHKGSCGAVFGAWSTGLRVNKCSFKDFSRLDNTDARSDSELIK